MGTFRSLIVGVIAWSDLGSEISIKDVDTRLNTQ